MIAVAIGIDVSKDHLDAHRLPDGSGKRVANSTAGLKALIAWIGRTPVDRVVYEATGAYHRLLETTLASAGLPLAKVNPVRLVASPRPPVSCARPIGVGAAMLARFGVALAPNQTQPLEQALDDIRGGRTILRQALYMPALVALRFNPDLKAKYLCLIVAGKPAKVAITTLMRKLIITANALLRDQRR